MSFGFSVGDVVAVGKLVGDIVGSLREIGGAKSEYQQLVRELECLDKTLCNLDRLTLSKHQPPEVLNSIKFAALTCRQPLEDFLNQIRKYETSLGTLAVDAPVKSVAHKLKWTFGKKSQVAKLESYLSVHVANINMLLSVYGIQTLELTSKTGEAQQLFVQEQLKETQGLIKGIEGNISIQTAVLQENQNMITTLFKAIRDDFPGSLRALINMVGRVCVSTQQIYVVIPEIKTSLSSISTQHTYFQQPVCVEDALGRKFPVAAESSFDCLIHIIQMRFESGPGSRDVAADNYELLDRKFPKRVINSSAQILPGMIIVMALLVGVPGKSEELCPVVSCKSARIVTLQCGAKRCSDCGVFIFDKASKKRKRLEHLAAAAEKDGKSSRCDPGGKSYTKRSKPNKTHEDETSLFKNVRFAEETANKLLEISQPHELNITGEPNPTLDDALAFLD